MDMTIDMLVDMFLDVTLKKLITYRLTLEVGSQYFAARYTVPQANCYLTNLKFKRHLEGEVYYHTCFVLILH